MQLYQVVAAIVLLILQMVEGYRTVYKRNSIGQVIQQIPPINVGKKVRTNLLIAGLLIGITPPVVAKDLPSLDRCFDAIAKEADANRGENIKRLRKDVDVGDWDDVKEWSREYEAGFRGGVLKSAWKQLEGDSRTKGIEITNSFTFDLIALNKAARKYDAEDARQRIDQVEKDLTEFLKLKP